MGNRKTSELAPATTLTGAEEIPVTQGGVSRAATAQQILAVSLPTSPAGLPAGAMWNNNGTVAVASSSSVTSLLQAMSDPTKQMPSFVEGWASNTFHGQDFNVPNGVASLPADSEGERILTLTVTGAAAATSLTGSGFDTVNGTGSWACTILHNDGTYGVYTASGITATTINISPPLRAATTAKPLASLGGQANGQHYGLQGYKALARRIFAVTKRDGYRVRYLDRWPASSLSGWVDVVGSPFTQYNFTGNQWPNAGAGSYFRSRGRAWMQFNGNTAGIGKSRTVSWSGPKSGYVETFVGITTGAATQYRVRLIANAVEVFNQVASAFTRIVAPFTDATTVTIEITSLNTASNVIVVGDTTVWEYDRANNWTDRALDINKKVVCMGDSWTARYSGGLGQELQAAITAAGGVGTVSTVATGGQTAEDGLARFDADVAPLLVDGATVVIEYFTNDRTAFGVANSDRWLTALYQIGIKCQALGARPIFVMPLPTQSAAQVTDHGTWAERIGIGLPSA